MDKLLYRVEEAAEVLSIGRTRVFQLVRTGELASVKIGKSRRVTAAAISEYLNDLHRRAA